MIALLVLSLLGQNASARSVDRTVYGAEGWTLSVSIDRFSQERVCQVTARHGAIFNGAAVGFPMPRGTDFGGVRYRVDDEAALTWNDDIPELARLRVSIDPRPLARAHDRLLWIPFDSLVGGRRIAISPGFGRRPKSYRLDGLHQIVESLPGLDCRLATAS